MAESNGFVRWAQLIWIVGIIFVILSFIGNGVIANENRNIASHDEIKQCITNYIIPIREDLSAIKMKLGIAANARDMMLDWKRMD